jgi:hypothetical protein
MFLNTLGDCWETVLAEDGNLYSVADDSIGVCDHTIVDRSDGEFTNFTINVFAGDKIGDLKGSTINHMSDYGMAGVFPENCADGCSWKAMGITSVDNVLYVSIGRHDYGTNSGESCIRQTAQNASIIKSYDRGRSWQRSSRENLISPMFPGGKFTTPYFIHYNMGGRESVHNSDRYVYALSNNGFWDNGDNMKLGRVLKSAIGNLDASDWEYYVGGDGMENASWSRDINASVCGKAGYVLDAPGRCGMTGAAYLADLDRYIMIPWYYTAGSGSDNEKAKELGLENPGQETVWDFYESPNPWGPWTRFYSHTFNPLGAYNPCIVTNFTNDGGSKFIIFTNGNFHIGESKNADLLYRLNVIECELTLCCSK